MFKNKRKVIVSTIILSIFVTFTASAKVSSIEKILAQKMLNEGLDINSKELLMLPNPSEYMPFLLGIAYLDEKIYKQAHNEFQKLSKEYQRSKIAQYFTALSKFGIGKRYNLQKLIYEFNWKLHDGNDRKFLFSEGQRPDSDQMYRKIRSVYALKEGGLTQARIERPAKRWFESLGTKRPLDFVIYAILQIETPHDYIKMRPEKSLEIIERGLKLYPKDPSLLKAAIYYQYFIDPTDTNKIQASLSNLPLTLYTRIMRIAVECPSDEGIEAWDITWAAPLCSSQSASFRATNWAGIDAVKQNLTRNLIDYFDKNVKGFFDKNINFELYLQLPLLGEPLAIFDLSKRVIVSAFELMKSKGSRRASDYLRWNRPIYRALDENLPKTWIVRNAQLALAINTWEAELKIAKAQDKPYTPKVRRLEDNLKRTKHLLDYFSEFRKRMMPYFAVLGAKRAIPLEFYEAELPQITDKQFLKE